MQYSWAQKMTIMPDLLNKVEQASNQAGDNQPHEMDPLALNASIIWSEDKSQLAIVMKVNLLKGWHIYAYVPETQPYIASELKLTLPDGITAISKWKKPYNSPYEKGIFIYEGNFVFVQYCSVANYKKGDVISSGLYYQTCDIHKCFPPETKTEQLQL